MDESLIVAIVMVTAAVIAFELRVSSAILEILAGIGLAFFVVDIAQLVDILWGSLIDPVD